MAALMYSLVLRPLTDFILQPPWLWDKIWEWPEDEAMLSASQFSVEVEWSGEELLFGQPARVNSLQLTAKSFPAVSNLRELDNVHKYPATTSPKLWCSVPDFVLRQNPEQN